jgi:hypothetical protein
LPAPKPPATFHTLALPPGTLEIRDAEAPDIDQFVRYWHFGGADLDLLRIDRENLGTAQQTATRFHASMRTGDLDQPSVAFTLALDTEPVGYFNVNRQSSSVNYPRLHLTSTSVRCRGLARAAIPYALRTIFDLYPIERVILQARTSVIAINKALDHLLPVDESLYLQAPDGLAGPGEFHHRYVHRGDAILAAIST